MTGQPQNAAQLLRGVLDTQGSAQTAGAALAAQDQPDAGRIHKPDPAKIQDQVWGRG